MSLSHVIRGLCGSLGGWYLRGLLSQALMMLVHRRLVDIGRRMERLAARFEAGQLLSRLPRLVRAEGRPSAPGGRSGRLAVRIWPGRFGWLLRLGGYQAAGLGEQLRGVLGQPEMVALLIAAPQAARLLRPVCRMLAVETTLLRPCVVRAVVVVPAEIVRVVKKRVLRPRGKFDPWRIPLPKGVLATARRQGFGKLS